MSQDFKISKIILKNRYKNWKRRPVLLLFHHYSSTAFFFIALAHSGGFLHSHFTVHILSHSCIPSSICKERFLSTCHIYISTMFYTYRQTVTHHHQTKSTQWCRSKCQGGLVLKLTGFSLLLWVWKSPRSN